MDYREAPKQAPLLVVSTDVTALDRQTGRMLWTYSIGEAARKFTVHERWVILLDQEGVLHCLDLTNGTLMGRINTGVRRANAFLFDGERFYVAGDDSVAAFDWNGAPLWSCKVPVNSSWSLAGLAVPGQVVQIDFSHG